MAHVRRRFAGVVVPVVAVALALGGVAAWPDDEAPPAPDEITPLVATVVAAPHPVPGADDRVHLAYELLVTNPTSFLVTVDKLEILDPRRGDALVGALDGPSLAAVMRPFGGEAGTTLGPAHTGVIIVDASFAADAEVPRSLAHRFAVSFQERAAPLADHDGVPLAPGVVPPVGTFVSGRTPVSDDEAVVVDPPLEGARWVAGNGCCAAANAHRNAVLPVNGAFHVAERFAIDFVQLDAGRRLFDGPIGDLSSYDYYGDRVLSAADGVVVGTQDGLPEQTPPDFPTDATAQTAGGNHVVVDIGDGRFAFYAHLQPGSLRVEVGDRVERGQVLGLLGNTGNSDAPHLHFHVMDGPSPLASNGLPFVFRSFASAGTVTDLEALAAGRPTPIGPALAGRHREQLPLDNQVVRFPRRRG